MENVDVVSVLFYFCVFCNLYKIRIERRTEELKIHFYVAQCLLNTT